MSSSSKLALGSALLAASAVSCSLLIGGEPEPMRCSLEGRVGPPACDAGLTCQGGVCRAVSPAVGGNDSDPVEASGGDGAGGRPEARPGR